MSARTERGPRGRVESSGEEDEGTEPLEAGFLGMTQTRTRKIWMEGGDERRSR